MTPRAENLPDRSSHRSNLATTDENASNRPSRARAVVTAHEDGGQAASDRPPAALPEMGPPARPPRQKPHALLVDDDQLFAETLAKLVGKEGFTTSIASTLAE